MRKIQVILCALVVLCCACNDRVIYNTFYSLPFEGWHQDSALIYTTEIADSTAHYEMLIVVRHTAQYPYQNLWLFVDEYAGDMLIYQDTVEATLADDYGRWLGRGINRYELSLLYDEQHRFTQSGEHSFAIRQGMRQEWLKGMTEVGLIIQQNNGKE